jgi:peptidoglycan/xylan/chitin deacetylase (PgdA/CDA1 family)
MIKRGMLKLLWVTGAFDLMRWINRHRALILTYHRFSHDNVKWRTSAQTFSKHLEYLTGNYRIVPLSVILEHLSKGETLPPALAAITIDDGYRDAYEVAYPLLRRYGVPATLYAVTEFVDRRVWLWTDKSRFLTEQASAQELVTTIDGEYFSIKLFDETSRSRAAEQINEALKRLDNDARDEAIKMIARELGVAIPEAPPDEFAAITWQQAREMDQKGVEIGSHTLTHPILTNIGNERLRHELSESRARLEAVLKRRVEHFCYPNGDFDERVQREVARAGYGSAVTVINGLNEVRGDLLRLRRINTESDMAHFAQSTSGFEQLKNSLRSHHSVEAYMEAPLIKKTSQEHR